MLLCDQTSSTRLTPSRVARLRVDMFDYAGTHRSQRGFAVRRARTLDDLETPICAAFGRDDTVRDRRLPFLSSRTIARISALHHDVISLHGQRHLQPARIPTSRQPPTPSPTRGPATCANSAPLVPQTLVSA